MHESNAFSVSNTEFLSSHIFRATNAVNIYIGKAVENAREELGNRFVSTTINSYIKPEKRQLNVLEKKYWFF